MQFRVASYRNGAAVLGSCPAFDEIADALTRIQTSDIQAAREERQAAYDAKAKAKGKQPTKAGIQAPLNARIKELLVDPALRWSSGVPVFEPDKGTRKGFWTMDFRKEFEKLGVGLEVTFNHAEALTWTPIRLTLAHEAVDVLAGSRIRAGAIVIASDHLKGIGSAGGLRMDSAVGTYERFRTVLPKIRSVVTVPLTIFALDWGDGGQSGIIEEISLHTSKSGIKSNG